MLVWVRRVLFSDHLHMHIFTYICVCVRMYILYYIHTYIYAYVYVYRGFVLPCGDIRNQQSLDPGFIVCLVLV